MGKKEKLAIVVGTLPTVDDIDQFRLLADRYDISVVSSESICGYLSQTSYFQDLTCLALPDYDENPGYLPGLEKALKDFNIVVVKERLGLYAYQAVKAKWRHRFKLLVWVDNLVPHVASDVNQLRTVRTETTNAADGFIVQTEAARTTLLLEGIEESRILKMIPWVEKRTKRNKKARAEACQALGLSETNIVISHFGQVEWEEGLSDLASAIRLACDQDDSFKQRVRVVFCGIGSYAPQLKEDFLNFGIDDVAVYVAPNRHSLSTILMASDAAYISYVPARDRVEGDPYRVLSAMANEVPVLASRSVIVEELCGKHRIDFCQGSPVSLAEALLKVASQATLVSDTVKKNAKTVSDRFSKEKAEAAMVKIFDGVTALKAAVGQSTLDHQVAEVEARILNKQYLAAVEIIESIFKLPDVPVHHRANLYRLVGDCFAKLGDSEAAKDAYLQAAELDPYSPKVFIGLGTIALIKNSYDVAVPHFQKSISLSPEDEMANLGLGLAFQGLKESKEATRWVVKSLEINPENTAGLYTLVKLAHETSQFKDAERCLKRYLEMHPNDYNMTFTLGGVLYKLNRCEEVVEIMNKILKVDPADNRAHSLLQQAERALDEAEVSSSNG